MPVDRDICAKTDEPTCQTVAPQEIILQVTAGIEYLARNASQSQPTVDSSLEAAGRQASGAPRYLGIRRIHSAATQRDSVGHGLGTPGSCARVPVERVNVESPARAQGRGSAAAELGGVRVPYLWIARSMETETRPIVVNPCFTHKRPIAISKIEVRKK